MYGTIDLPPIQDPNKLGTPSRLLPPLEPVAVPLKDSSSTSSTSAQKRALSSNHGSSVPSGQGASKAVAKLNEQGRNRSSPQTLQKILGVDTELTTLQSKRRQTADTSKDDFVQLPQPPKKQKTITQVPPIIIGLFEPPPNAALFPPIAPSSFHDSHGRNALNVGPPQETRQEIVKEVLQNGVDDKAGEVRKETIKEREVRARKKWTEEETNHLLLGVHKHGVGNWTKILQDAEFKFNGRRAVDLKDRFRTCCPSELRNTAKEASVSGHLAKSTVRGKQNARSSLLNENILIDDGVQSSDESADSDPPNIQSMRPRTSRTHRKELEDLAELGIDGPFKKSSRRQRRPFTEQEDQAIRLGFEKYGSAWSLIQRDPQYGLQSRKPTDIRDRLRNKYPELYNSLEETRKAQRIALGYVPAAIPPWASALDLPQPDPTRAFNTKPTREDTVLPAKVTPHQALPTAYTFRDVVLDFPQPSSAADNADPLAFPPAFDLYDNDMSRLMLDDWPGPVSGASNSGKQKQSYTDISSLLTSTADVPQSYGLPALDHLTVMLPPPYFDSNPGHRYF